MSSGVTIGMLKRLSQLMAGQSASAVAITGGTISGVAPSFQAGSVAATGSNQGTAASLAYAVNNVTAADGTKGVILPAATAGKLVYVYNSVATNGLPIYPATGETINGGSANAAITIEGKTLAILVGSGAGNWGAVFTANT